MKKRFIIPALCFSATIFAQNIEEKIPENATVVAKANGENLLDLMSITELDESILGKSLLRMVEEPGSDVKASLTDFGFNIDASSYYFLSMNDSVFYNTLIVPIANDAKMEQFFTKAMRKEIVQEQELHTFEGTPENPVMVWNKDMLVLVYPSLGDTYFKKPEVMERYGLSEEKTFDFSDWGVDEEDDTYYDDATGEEYRFDENGDTIWVETPMEIEQPAGPSNYEIKSQLTAAWGFDKAKEILRKNPANNIAKNKSYSKNIDKDAVLSFYVGNYETFMTSVGNNIGSYSAMMNMMNFADIYQDASATTNLYLKEDEIKVESISTMSKDLASDYKKIFDRKLNKDFVKYINQDKSIAYVSVAMNTEEILVRYPKMIQNLYKDFPSYGEEIDLALEAFSLLLDEEAVGQVIKGDALFLLNGFSEQEKTYTTYDYDEDFNYVEKEETKTETLPDFLLMLSSDDTRLIQKLIDYGVKKNLVSQSGAFYELAIPNSPMALYFAIHDDILFLGTSADDLAAITTNSFESNVSRTTEKLITKNKFSAYFNPSVLAAKLPVEEMNVTTMRSVLNVLNNLGEFTVHGSKLCGKSFKTEASMKLPEGTKNGLTYLFDFVQNMNR